MTLMEQKKVAELCFGSVSDGTFPINYIFNAQLQYLIN